MRVQSCPGVTNLVPWCVPLCLERLCVLTSAMNELLIWQNRYLYDVKTSFAEHILVSVTKWNLSARPTKLRLNWFVLLTYQNELASYNPLRRNWQQQTPSLNLAALRSRIYFQGEHRADRADGGHVIGCDNRCFRVLSVTVRLTQWSRVLFEKVVFAQLLKVFPTVCGSRRSFSMFTRAPHWSISWAILIQITVFSPVFMNKRSSRFPKCR
jgi:hypothetical protein